MSSAEQLADLAADLQSVAEASATEVRSLAEVLWAEYELLQEAKREAEAFTGFNGIGAQ